jgi:hypothetical protein
MSWLERINTGMKITTGDTAQYYPKWINANKSAEYNYSEFIFKGVTGSFVSRRLPKGRRYNLDIIFEGADCLEVSDAFNKSADNPKAWTIEHPVYGQIVVQPTDLKVDNSVYNITKFQCSIIETIGVKAINTGVSAPDAIVAQAVRVQSTFTETFAAEIPAPEASLVQSMTANVNSLYNSISAKISDSVDFTNFTNAYSQVNNLLNTTITDSANLIGQIQDLAAFPANFAGTVYNRLVLLGLQFQGLYAGIATPHQKRLYENNAGTSILAMCVASVTNYDYVTRNNVLSAVTVILDSYNTYLANLDALQSNVGGNVDSYIPDPDSITGVSDVVQFTLASLFSIAASAKQQRTLIVKEDTNLILLAYQLYGLLQDDSTIAALKADNNIGLQEALSIKKNRQILYYV